jgi:hypothetical protein
MKNINNDNNENNGGIEKRNNQWRRNVKIWKSLNETVAATNNNNNQ